jgi:hypothetical protein
MLSMQPIQAVRLTFIMALSKTTQCRHSSMSLAGETEGEDEAYWVVVKAALARVELLIAVQYLSRTRKVT